MQLTSALFKGTVIMEFDCFYKVFCVLILPLNFAETVCQTFVVCNFLLTFEKENAYSALEFSLHAVRIFSKPW